MISIEGSIRTCKVNTGNASKIQTDRMFNPENMVCIPWNGFNNKGQEVCPDSWWTKTPGCNSAGDRVTVETDLRPDYAAYINLNMQGLQGDIYEGSNPFVKEAASDAEKWDESRSDISGGFGSTQWNSTNIPTCGLYSYERAMAQQSQSNRNTQNANLGYAAAVNRRNAGTDVPNSQNRGAVRSCRS